MEDSALTILGGRGFVLGEYVKQFYDPSIGNIASVNDRPDYKVHSPSVLYGISTIHNFHVVQGNPYIDIDTNLSTLIHVLENWRLWCLENKQSGVFNFCSSWFVYDSGESVKEAHPCNPEGFYSITKRAAEQLLVSYCDTYGLRYRILRLGNVIGATDSKVSKHKNVLQYLIQKLIRNENITLSGKGNFYRDYIHVEDCARAIEIVLAKGAVNTIYNVGNGKSWSFRNILEYAKRRLGSASEIELSLQPIKSLYMNTKKIRDLGYRPSYIGVEMYDSIIPASGTAGNCSCPTSY